MKVLVTGSEGFVGSALMREIAHRWPDAEVMGLGQPPDDELRDMPTLERIYAFDPEVVFHLAAEHFIPWCVEHPRDTLDINAIVTQELLQTVRASTFVLASSAAVYGLLPPGSSAAFQEDDIPDPIDVYGLSKVWAEEALRLAAIRRPARYVAARLFNIVGEGDKTPHLLPLIKAAAGGVAHLDAEGLRSRRDYVDVGDIAHALVLLAESAPQGFTACNVSTGVARSGLELCERFNVQVVDDPAKRRTGPKGDLIGSTALLERLTGFRPAPMFG